MIQYMQDRVTERVDLTNTMQRMADTAAAAGRDLSETETATIADMQARCVAIDAQLVTHGEQLDSARSFAVLQDKLAAHRDTDTDRGRPEQRGAAQVETTAGAIFIESGEFRDYRGRGSSAPVELGSALEFRAPITTADLAIPAFRWVNVERQYKPKLLNVVNRVLVSSGTVEWVEVGPDPVAAVVPEGTAKPEATWTTTPHTEALDTIAHWVQITRQALEDAPYIRSLIEGKLRRGLVAKAEQDLAAALVAATLPTAAGEDLLAAIRVGIGTVEGAGYDPNAVLLNPADFAGLDNTVLQETNSGPNRNTNFWGLTPIAVPSQPAGTATVGDFEAGVTLFDRGTTSVFLTDSHASLFISNILVILAEARLKSAVTEPTALCECAATVIP